MKNQRKTKQKHPVATVAELPPGARKLVEIDGKSLGIFNVKGEYMAVLNLCPHEFAPVCMGRVGGTTLPSAPGEFKWGREGEILACPWHGWEFDLRTGQCLTDRSKLRKYPVVVEEGQILIEL